MDGGDRIARDEGCHTEKDTYVGMKDGGNRRLVGRLSGFTVKLRI